MVDDPNVVVDPPKDDPVVDPKPADDIPKPPEDIYDPEKALVEARQTQRTRLEDIGGKFDAQGNFLGFEDTPSANQPNLAPVLKDDPTIEEALDFKLNQLEGRLMGALQPAATTSVLARVVETHPELAPYKEVAAKMLKNTPAGQVNEQSVLTLLYFARGQGADVEIATARNTEREKAKKEREELAAGAGAGSEGGGGSPPGSGGKPVVTDEIKKAAEAWGMKPEDLAAKLAAARKAAK